MIAIKRTEVRILGIDEAFMREAYQRKTGYEIDLEAIQWDGDYDGDGVEFSYLSGVGRVFLPEYGDPDKVPDHVAEDILAEEIILDDGKVIAYLSLSTLEGLVVDELLEKYGYLRQKEPYTAGIEWAERAMGSYEGTLVVTLDEEKISQKEAIV